MYKVLSLDCLHNEEYRKDYEKLLVKITNMTQYTQNISTQKKTQIE
jgi:hypothetical protein